MVIVIGGVRCVGSEISMVTVQDVLTRKTRTQQRKSVISVTILKVRMFVAITMELVNIKDSC